MITTRKFERRIYENAALVAARKTRKMYLFWTRRGRKSTTLGSIAFDALSSAPGETVIAASASLLVGSELVNMAINSTEQAIRVTQEALALRRSIDQSIPVNTSFNLVAANSETGKIYNNVPDADFADLYQSKRLEYRLYFDRTAYSRLLVIAPNPATARGWGGWVIRDEQMFTSPEMERELQIATNPIFDTDPNFRMIYASNLCGDDRHPGYEMTIPREPIKFESNPQGHFYISQTGLLVHRVNLADAYAAGHTLYDNSGNAQSLEQSLKGMTPSERKQNYMLIHEASGTAVCDALALHSAQARGVGHCAHVYVDSDADFNRALDHLRSNIHPGLMTGIGFDVATTEKAKSNPASLTVTQRNGVEFSEVLVATWKTKDPEIARHRIRRIAEVCKASAAPPRRLCVDGSNEQYFARDLQRELRQLLPVEIIINGSSVQPLPAGYTSPVNYKQYLGDIYSTQINDNHYRLPPEYYVYKDHRSVVKDRGRYDADVDNDGGHGDTFDSGKLAQQALLSGSGIFEGCAVDVAGSSTAGEDTHEDEFWNNDYEEKFEVTV
jgi:hypothetical protein